MHCVPCGIVKCIARRLGLAFDGVEFNIAWSEWQGIAYYTNPANHCGDNMLRLT
jgi:hypothetical protein